jgi:hypothetical protein
MTISHDTVLEIIRNFTIEDILLYLGKCKLER